MKKFLALCLAVLLLPVSALALPDAPYDPALMLRYATLTKAQQDIFDMLYAAALRREERAALPADTLYCDADAAADALITDCPELCGLENRYAVGYYQDEPDKAIWVSLFYGVSLAEQEAMLAEARAMAASVSGDGWQRAAQLEELLCLRTDYVADAPHKDSAYGALLDGAATCEGYARAMLLLCRLADIPCALLTGTAWNSGGTQLHAWNVLELDGVYTQADVTWDDGGAYGVTRWYFGLTDDRMQADHQWEDAPWPCTDDALAWHARQGLLLPENEEAARSLFAEAVSRLVRTGEQVNLRIADAEMYRDMVDNMDLWLQAYNRACPEDEIFTGAYRMLISEAQQCIILFRGE